LLYYKTTDPFSKIFVHPLEAMGLFLLL